MVQPKYSPEEALERVKLMMKYDLSKTSVENKKVVSEQTQSSTPDPLSCIKNYFQTKTYFYYKGAKFNRNSITGISEMEVTLNSKLIWKFFSGNNGNRTWKQFSEGTLTDEGSWSCNGDSNFTMKSNSGKLNFDSKNSEEFFKQIQSGGQPTQSQSTSSDPYSCIKTFFQANRYLFSSISHSKNSIYGTNELEVKLKMSNLTWKFFNWNDGKKTWKQYTNGDFTDSGLWRCDGDSNFTMESTVDELNFNSRNFEQFFSQTQPVAQPTQTQPVAQPTQTGPAAGYTDANQQSTLRRQDSILSDILDNQSVDKSVCSKYITAFYRSFKQKNSIVVDPETIAKEKRIVQACRDQHYGKFGMLGMLDSGREKGPDGEKINIDDMLDILSGRKEGGPLTQGSDSMWRIK